MSEATGPHKASWLASEEIDKNLECSEVFGGFLEQQQQQQKYI